MTRNFEEEYKKYADASVPDLWSRIEAAIDKDTENETAPVHEENKSRNNKKKVTVFTARYAWILAACACLLLTFGALKLINGTKDHAAMEAAPAAESADYASEAASDEYVSEAAKQEEANEYEEAAAYEPESDNSVEDDEPIAMAAASADRSNDQKAEIISDADKKTLGADTAGETNNYAAAEAAAEEVMADEEAAPAMAEAQEEYTAAEAEEDTYSATAAVGEAAAEMMIICRIDDMSALVSDHMIKVFVTDPLDSGLEKGSVIDVSVNDEEETSLQDVTKGSSKKEYTVILNCENGDKYTLLEIRE